MIAGFLILLPTVLGLAGWLPRDLPVGARLFLGAAAVPLILHLGADLAGLPVSGLAWLLAGLAGAGLIAGAVRLVRYGRPSAAVLTHPALVLPAALLVVLVAGGPADYLPHSWDEFSNWLYWARQIFAADVAWRSDMYFSTVGYTQGWPLAIAYPQVFFGSFEEARAVPLAFLLHSGLLGLLYDVAVRLLSGPTGEAAPRRWAWVIVLLLAAAEAFWKLLPESLLIDEPLTQVLAGAFGLVLLAAASEPAERQRLALAAGVAAGAAFALKTAAITALPALALAALALSGHWRWRLALAAALTLPLIALQLAWSVANPAVATCSPPVLRALLVDLPGPDGALLRAVGGHFVHDSLDFLGTYKLPLSVLAALGLGLAARGRLAAGTIAVAAFAAAFAAALWLSYAYCFSPYERDALASLSRYLRAPVRVAHGLGLLLLCCLAIDWFRRQGQARLHDLLAAVIPVRWQEPAGAALLLALIVGLGGLQVRAVTRSLANLTTRVNETPADIQRVLDLKARTVALGAVLDQAGLADPQVALITQGGDGAETVIVRYFALAGRPHLPLRRFHLSDRFSWGDTAANVWMAAATPASARTELARAEVIWPYRLDPWMSAVLAGLALDPGCPENLENQILLRSRDRPDRLVCRALALPPGPAAASGLTLPRRD